MKDFIFTAFVDHPIILSSLWSAICFSCGAVFNHKLAMGREKRKEYNSAADAIMLILREQKSDLVEGFWPRRFISDGEIYSLMVNHGAIKRSMAGKAWRRYQKARDNDGPAYTESGDCLPFDSGPMLDAVEKLMKYVKHK